MAFVQAAGGKSQRRVGGVAHDVAIQLCRSTANGPIGAKGIFADDQPVRLGAKVTVVPAMVASVCQ